MLHAFRTLALLYGVFMLYLVLNVIQMILR